MYIYIFFGFACIRKKTNSDPEYLVPTLAKHVLLVHMNMLQGLKIHEGLKVKYVIIHKLSNVHKSM